MNKKKTLKKIIPFWEDTEAISPVVATILVLAVAVAAGLGLYLWFNPFQANVQAQIGTSSNSSVNLMADTTLGNNVRLCKNSLQSPP
ncbi:MAG: archaellin/type IV pilin N-terminal domain-containing protein [archaeon]